MGFFSSKWQNESSVLYIYEYDHIKEENNFLPVGISKFKEGIFACCCFFSSIFRMLIRFSGEGEFLCYIEICFMCTCGTFSSKFVWSLTTMFKNCIFFGLYRSFNHYILKYIFIVIIQIVIFTVCSSTFMNLQSCNGACVCIFLI